MQPFLQRHRVLLLHMSFWAVYLSFTLYQTSVFQQNKGVEWGWLLLSRGIEWFFTVLVVYLNYFITLPRFLKHQVIWRYLLEFSVPFAVLITARVYAQQWLVDGFSHKIDYFYSNIFIVQVTAIT